MRANHDMLLCESSFLLFCYGPKARPPLLSKEHLTARQWEVYKHLKSGLNAREISDKTGLTYNGVHGHISFIKKKGWLA